MNYLTEPTWSRPSQTDIQYIMSIVSDSSKKEAILSLTEYHNMYEATRDLEARVLERVDNMDEADIRLVEAQTQCKRYEAINALHKHKGDLLGAILEICDSRDVTESNIGSTER